MMAQWFGPRGFTIPVCELDVCKGGSLRIVMRGPDGNDHPMKGVFLAVIEPERLVFTNIAASTCLRARRKSLFRKRTARPRLS